jgi:hypothetical protein
LEAQGGAATDYRLWSQDAQGVAEVYPYAKSGAVGEVNLFVEATVADSTDGKGTPSASLLDDVEEVVEFNPDTTLPTNERGRRPIQVIVNYLPITPLDVDITINGFTNVTPALQVQIDAALQRLIDSIRPFVDAADVLENKNDILDINKIVATIIDVYPSAQFSSVTLVVNAVATPTYTFVNGDIPYLNSVAYA